MKFFHMADLHLGKKLLGEPLLKEQQAALAQVLELVEKEKPDGIFLCGDIYDKPIPPAEAVKIFDEFLEALSIEGVEVFLISGNHDSGQRLDFAKGILKKEKIHMEGTFEGKLKKITLKDAYGKLNVFLLPFLRPGMLKPYTDEILESYEAAVRFVLEGAGLERKERNVLLAHQFVTKNGAAPETSDSEQLSLGGLDNVDVSCFERFDYTALGHIHKAQKVGGVNVRYAGSLLKYSFSEWQHQKSVTIVEFKEKGDISIRKSRLEPMTKMAVLRDTMEHLLSDSYKVYREGYYLSVCVTDEGLLEQPLEQLRKYFSGILAFAVDNARTRKREISFVNQSTGLKRTPKVLFEEFYEKQNGTKMTEAETRVVEQLLEKMGEEVL